MKHRGYVSLYRSIWNHWLWEEKPFSKGQAWIDLLLLANYKDEKFGYKDQVIEGKRGTVYRSITFLADRWGWGRDKVSRFLRQLESDGMVEVQTSTHRTTIFISNYQQFQDFGLPASVTEGDTNRQVVGSQSATGRRQVGTYNKVNNKNKLNKVNKDEGLPVQSAEEVAAAEEWFDSLDET